MKKKILTIILAVLVFGSVTALGFAGVTYIQNKALEAESSALLAPAAKSGARKTENSAEIVQTRITGADTGIDLRQLMRAKGYYEDDIAMAVAKLIDLFVYYNMTQEEYDYIVSLVKLGYDPEQLASIYQFLLLTPDNITVMRQIYDAGIAFADERFWIENAYEMVKGIGSQTLSLEEVDAYVKNGITTDEIVLCYQMSPNGTKEIREILGAKQNGASWPQVCELVYGADELAASGFDPDMDLRSLQTLIMLARRTGNKTKDILLQDESGVVQVKQQVLEKFDATSEHAKTIRQSLDADPQDTEKFKRVIKEKARGISDEAAEKLAQEGYRAKEVKKALTQGAVDEASIKIRDIVDSVDGEVEQP